MLAPHTTALSLLRSPALCHALTRGERCSAMLPDARPEHDEVTALLERLPKHNGPLDALVSPHVNRRQRPDVSMHSSCLVLPPDSAIRVSESLLCTSPEHLLVQMAPRLTLIELIFLMGELLGIYAIAPDHEEGMFERSGPITTPELVRAHLAQLGPAPGTAQVKFALDHACTNSASPYETKLSIRCGLRPGLGGFHLNVLSMNGPLEVRRIVERLGSGVRKPDVFLGSTSPGSPFDVVGFDYHGRIHERPSSTTADLGRQNELLGINCKVYAFNKDLYDDLEYMEGIMRRARADLGMPREKLSPKELERRRALRQWLHDELEHIDGVKWEGRLREAERKRRGAELDVPDDAIELVPVDAYGLD